MSSDNIAIRVQELSKCYQIYNAPKDRLKQFILPRVQRLLGKQSKEYFQEFWAVKDISFVLQKGETIGIVGVNGSGKSTLLQIVCGILTPSSGTVYSKGRIAALLELGSGFNPDFTGRENVYLNGAVLGLSKDEVSERFADIEAFADIGEFIEQPVRMYSSGMTVRLAFSIAINVDPQILVVDEALSVGDAAFQRKCFARLKSIQDQGATILFVSHDAGAIVDLCNRAILLDHGKLLYIDRPKKVIALYQKLLFAPADKIEDIRNKIINNLETGGIANEALKEDNVHSMQNDELPEQERGESKSYLNPQLLPKSTVWYDPNGAVIDRPRILENFHKRQVNMLVRNEEYIYTYRVRFLDDAVNVRFCMLIKTIRGIEIGGYGNTVEDDSMKLISKGTVAEVHLRFKCTLLPGIYFMNVGVVGSTKCGDEYLHRGIDVVMFEVIHEKAIPSTAIVDFGITQTVFLKRND